MKYRLLIDIEIAADFYSSLDQMQDILFQNYEVIDLIFLYWIRQQRLVNQQTEVSV